MNTDLWIAVFMLLACGGLVATSIMALQIDARQPGPDSQAYFDTDGDPRNHYAGAEYIGRAGDVRRTQCDMGDGAWPATVVGRVEFYVDGAWQTEADCAVECRVTLFDADGDGRLTLEDYAEFQRAFGD